MSCDIPSLNYSNYYKLLGLKENASMSEIKDAYRRLVLEFHPDKNISAKDGIKFKLITEAYHTLRIKTVNTNRDFGHQDEKVEDHAYKKIHSWNSYLNSFYDLLDHARHTRYAENACKHISEYEPAFVKCCELVQRCVVMPMNHSITSSYSHVVSFVSHTSYKRLIRGLLKHPDLHS